ncbi:AraC family transcriptional regulator [Paenibacillus agaridevorans]|uniref:AraC family transcriptional regulator n=1 Tax=Paenibacillus agaridevorans TaxID=171404 RepID=A0A2R5F045_9BACL|nr:AraC family transcriptional regulator [Paenibacillus agaridevorans]GBG11725.1 AraC family transcriptional regulator [Paenibacillus agaridevorans]
MMPFLLADNANLEHRLPFSVICVGSHEQKEIDRRENGYPAHQLFLTRSGQGTFRMLGGKTFTVSKGMALLLPAHTGHRYRSDDESEEVWHLGFVAFGGGMADALMSQMDDLVLFAGEAPNFNELWLQLEGIWHTINKGGEHAYEASRRLYDLLLTFMEGHHPAAQSTKKIYPTDQPNPALQAAVKLIHDHYGERLLLSNVARAAGYSVQHFHRLFVANYGMTPQQYVLQLRMRRSVQLFQDYPGITVDRVADKLGMDASYFIRMFKRTYGVTPKQYAKGHIVADDC